jgi:hypothetical protein
MITPKDRNEAMSKLLGMWGEKSYRLETLFLGAYILDRSLANDIQRVTPPDLILYVVTSLILAAKIE